MLTVQYRRLLPVADFIDTYSPLIWVMFCGIVAVAYTFVVQRQAMLDNHWLLNSARLSLLLCVAVAIDFVIYRYSHPQEFFDTTLQGALYFVAIPGTIVSFLCGCVAGIAVQRRSVS